MKSESNTLYHRAEQVIPAGVNSPVRAFRAVGGNPLFIARGQGAKIFDVDDNQYIDYVGSWGPLILGHAHPEVIQAIVNAAESGTSFGAPTEAEILLAEKISQLVPSIELSRLVNSGTEAAMTAIRIARGYTGRDKIIKFIGCYHGHSDALLVKAGSGNLTFGSPDSNGVTKGCAQDTLLCSYNDIHTVKQLFDKYQNEIAAVIVEPVAGNMNCVLPIPGFLSQLREICDNYDSLLIFDEVITGFRVALGGAQQRFNITPDLTILGKVIGGGLPIAAVGGRREIMEVLSPLGDVYQAGTLSGNPIAVAAGLKTLELISKNNFHHDLETKTIQLTDGIMERAHAFNIPVQCNQIGGMFGLFFTKSKVINNYEQVKTCNVEHFKQFFNGMLEQGIYLAPSAFEVGFISSAHTKQDITDTLNAVEKIFHSFSSTLA